MTGSSETEPEQEEQGEMGGAGGRSSGVWSPQRPGSDTGGQEGRGATDVTAHTTGPSAGPPCGPAGQRRVAQCEGGGGRSGALVSGGSRKDEGREPVAKSGSGSEAEVYPWKQTQRAEPSHVRGRRGWTRVAVAGGALGIREPEQGLIPV